VTADGSVASSVEWDMIPGAVLRLAYRPGDGTGRYEERVEATAHELGYVTSLSFPVGLAHTLSVRPLREATVGRFLPLEIRLDEGVGMDPGSLAGRGLALKILPGADGIPVRDGEAGFRAGEGGILLFSLEGSPFGLLPTRTGPLSFRVSLEAEGGLVATASLSALPVGPPASGSASLLRGLAAAEPAGLDLPGVLGLMARGEPFPRSLGRVLSKSAPAMAVFARAYLEGIPAEDPEVLRSVLVAADRWGLLFFSRGGLKGFRLFGASGAELSQSSPLISAGSAGVVLTFPKGERRMVRLAGNGAAPVRLLKILPGGINRKEYPAGTWTKEIDVYGDMVVPPKR
jgi:hypothetical protein